MYHWLQYNNRPMFHQYHRLIAFLLFLNDYIPGNYLNILYRLWLLHQVRPDPSCLRYS